LLKIKYKPLTSINQIFSKIRMANRAKFRLTQATELKETKLMKLILFMKKSKVTKSTT